MQLCTDQRNQLNEESIEVGKCQKLWASEALITFGSAAEISKRLDEAEKSSMLLETL